MSFAKNLSTLLGFLFLTTAAALTASEEDHNWSLSGTPSSELGENEIYIAVQNDTALSSVVVIEVHYDTTVLEIGTASLFLSPGTDFEPVGERMDSIAVMGSKPAGTSGVARFTIYSTADPPYNYIVAGTGDIIRVVFKVKLGVASGTTTLQLTTINSKAELATREIEIQGMPAPGNPEDFNWSLSGILVAGSQETEIFVMVRNDLWFGNVVFDVFYDSTLLEIKQPLADNVLLVSRAAAMNFTPSHEAGSNYVRLTVSTSEEDPAFPSIEAGSGTIAKLNFNIKTPMQSGETTTLQVKLSDQTELASLTMTAREFTGPSADVSGDGKEDVFDLLDLLKVLGGSVPKSVFSDVNDDGKTDIFDLLEILRQLSGK